MEKRAAGGGKYNFYRCGCAIRVRSLPLLCAAFCAANLQVTVGDFKHGSVKNGVSAINEHSALSMCSITLWVKRYTL